MILNDGLEKIWKEVFEIYILKQQHIICIEELRKIMKHLKIATLWAEKQSQNLLNI
jgi:hypothetical protein